MSCITRCADHHLCDNCLTELDQLRAKAAELDTVRADLAQVTAMLRELRASVK